MYLNLCAYPQTALGNYPVLAVVTQQVSQLVITGLDNAAVCRLTDDLHASVSPFFPLGLRNTATDAPQSHPLIFTAQPGQTSRMSQPVLSLQSSGCGPPAGCSTTFDQFYGVSACAPQLSQTVE